MVHGLHDGDDFRAGLRGLVGGEVADVAGTDGEDALAEEGVLHVHHLLDDGGGIDARQVVVLKYRHKRNRTSGHHQIFGIHVVDAAIFQILDGHAGTFEQIPNGGVEEDAAVVVAGQRLGDVETTHAAVQFLFLEEEELVGLHVELAAHALVVVDDDVADTLFVEHLAAGQSRRTGTDDDDLGLVNLLGLLFRFGALREVVLGNLLHLLHTVHRGDAYSLDDAVHQHLAGTALADAALEGALASVDAVAVDGKTSLVQGCSNGVALVSRHLLSVKGKNDFFRFRNV